MQICNNPQLLRIISIQPVVIYRYVISYARTQIKHVSRLKIPIIFNKMLEMEVCWCLTTHQQLSPIWATVGNGNTVAAAICVYCMRVGWSLRVCVCLLVNTDDQDYAKYSNRERIRFGNKRCNTPKFINVYDLY